MLSVSVSNRQLHLFSQETQKGYPAIDHPLLFCNLFHSKSMKQFTFREDSAIEPVTVFQMAQRVFANGLLILQAFQRARTSLQ